MKQNAVLERQRIKTAICGLHYHPSDPFFFIAFIVMYFCSPSKQNYSEGEILIRVKSLELHICTV